MHRYLGVEESQSIKGGGKYLIIEARFIYHEAHAYLSRAMKASLERSPMNGFRFQQQRAVCST